MTKFLKKHWPLAGILVLLAVVSFYLIQAQKEPIQKPALAEADADEGVKLEDIHYTQNDPDQRVKWVLDATEVKLTKDKRYIRFRDFRLRLEPEDRPAVELEGKKGKYDKNTGEITLRGNLRGRTDNGYRFMTERAIYKQKQGDLETDQPVKIIGPFFSVEGRGLYFNVENEILIIHHNVTTSIDNDALIL
ncbi:MAG: LPS export ABC transporter periplasmic protein LptC [Desulfobacteraceae bacterium]|jgi:LPS export ABC transporter protein LptC